MNEKPPLYQVEPGQSREAYWKDTLKMLLSLVIRPGEERAVASPENFYTINSLIQDAQQIKR